ncbi:ABC transporter permease [Massilia sp. YMA4]|uniref:ABC transporter permease n=1 Tax=Massilia sp. YMA4 TaxID=1593482 RepID=UPI000DD14D86|nr:FtsX-like permease family protein [Massilia sp. YMA4]AXA90761.1 ABC transporter permease [Massilia sp. YMA4]
MNDKNITGDLRLAWRALLAEPAYAAIAILGLGIGLAACLLLLGYVRHAWQYNAAIADVDALYVVKLRNNIDPASPWFDQGPLLLRGVAAATPGVTSATAFVPARPNGAGLSMRVDGRMQELPGLAVMAGFAQTLGLRALAGDVAGTLARPDQLVLTADGARRLFGTGPALGRTLEVQGKLMRVGAVVPANGPTTIPFQALVGVGSVVMDPAFARAMDGASGWWGKMLLRLAPGTRPQGVAAALQAAADGAAVLHDYPAEVKARLAGRRALEIELAPLREAYFDRDVAANHIAQPGERADPVTVGALAGIALLILALAACNYVNLATVRVLRRQREVALRKVLGAPPARIALQFLAESVLVALLATACGLLLAWLALPLFGTLMNRDLGTIVTWANLAAAMLLGCMLGLATAVYPAWTALRVPPRQVLAGRAGTESAAGARWRRALTMLQLASAMAFGAVALAIAWQAAFAMTAPPGFDPAPLLVVDMPEPDWNEPPARGFATAVAALPAVQGVAVSQDAVGRQNAAWMAEMKRPGGASASMDMRPVSAAFFEVYGLRALHGRLYDPRRDRDDDAMPLVLNAVAARALGFADPAAAVGQLVLFPQFDGKVQQKRVVGIAPELRLRSLREPARPVAYALWAAQPTLSVRVRDGADPAAVARVEREVRALWPTYFPAALPKMQPAGAVLAAGYADDQRIGRLLGAATLVALGIAAFGTYALAAHTVQRRTGEIVLRKLYGARRPQIGWLVAREVGGLLLPAALLALPLAALAIERYLSGFVERAPIGGWTLAAALGGTLLVAALAAARHAWVAMRLVPAAALRG